MDGMIISGERRRAGAEWQHNAALAAAALSTDVGADDCVAICLRNDFEFFEISAACALLGAYATPINWHYTAAEAGYILRDCDTKVLVIHADLLAAVAAAIPPQCRVVVVATPPEIAAAYRLDPPPLADAIPPELASRAITWPQFIAGVEPWRAPPPASRGTMIYTSGTTGHPKGVRRAPMDEATQQRVAQATLEGFGIPIDASQMRCLMAGPMYHSAPNLYGLTAARNGALQVLQARFDAEQLLRLVEHYAISHMHVVPTMFVRLLRLPAATRARYDLSSLRHVVHGAAPCPQEIKQQMIDWWGPVIHEYYGSTENGLITVANSAMARQKPGTVGTPICGNAIRVLDSQRRPLPAGEIGEIFVWRPNRAIWTYHKRDDARREIEADGFLTNGDMGWLDDDGWLFLADRRNDMIISGGVNIYPAEIEQVLIDCPGVLDCAVFGVPHPEFGESPAAHVELSDLNLSVETIKTFLRTRLAGFKVPTMVVIDKHLPREDSGKIFKRKLRERYWRDAAGQ